MIVSKEQALEQEPPAVIKRTFKIDNHRTYLGQSIKEVRLGWECHGTLNAARDNAIVVFHHLHGHSHFAGKYRSTEKRAGYWDGLIGPGKVIDTDRFFVLSMDSLCNVNAYHPDVVTTGPASINPDTGKPYGPTFPIITYHDMVDTQVALLDHLGIKTLHAALGVSAGGHHCLELATAYPKRVRKIIPIACGLQSDAWLIAWANVWIAQLKLDPDWNGGYHHEDRKPTQGLIAALKMISMIGRDWSYTNDPVIPADTGGRKIFGRAWADPERDPATSPDHRYLIEADLERGAVNGARHMDANHFHYLAQAAKSFTIRRSGSMTATLARLRAEVLMIHHLNADHLSRTETVTAAIARMLEVGVRMEVLELSGTLGHIDFVAIQQPRVASAIGRFLAR
ncbi:homoserine O-acetyltransferase [Skermanella stibiiresistens SB22]|uniref:Homoserine O-acetyltransferase n=1 Tax=Skermanella stibiiresistens SB22 TaxID=1385369 RepID=W9H728_9PROT|nr:homoserine O-acetyltransferase [Skermanella stibiiresistens]EWY39578.1 homoserine O-acetyltransferase [Skermanella stibiiresistens SB22]